jgi:hydrogenase/urease accessory protein HupE
VVEYCSAVHTVTAFTLSHSFTLAAANLGILRVPTPPVEAVIALSIVFLACELCQPRQHRDALTIRAPAVVAFIFGLIHGLGFAGALRDIGLPEADIPLALFSFNIGVELGQLGFIGVVLLIGAVLRLIWPSLGFHTERIKRGTGYGAGSIAAFWVIERIAGF